MSDIGRNQICPLCNSGKKYKKCCLPKKEAAEAEARRIEEIEFQEWFKHDLAEGAANLAETKATLKSLQMNEGISPKQKEQG
jgi:hypothetical protein